MLSPSLSLLPFFPLLCFWSGNKCSRWHEHFVCKYRKSKAKKDFILIPVKSITGSDVVVVVSGQSFPQTVPLEQTWDSSKRDLVPEFPGEQRHWWERLLCRLPAPPPPGSWAPSPLAIPVPGKFWKRGVNAKINAVFSFQLH